MKRRTIWLITRVTTFSVMCLVFMFVLITVFGQFRFDSRASYHAVFTNCLLYTSPSPRDGLLSRMPSSA